MTTRYSSGRLTLGNLTFTSEKAVQTFAKIEEMISKRAARKSDIAAELNVSERYLSLMFAYLRAANKMHIHTYEFSTDMKKNMYQAYYKWGPGVDADKPTKDMEPVPKYDVADEADEPEVVWTRPKVPDFIPRRDWAASWVPDRSKEKDNAT